MKKDSRPTEKIATNPIEPHPNEAAGSAPTSGPGETEAAQAASTNASPFNNLDALRKRQDFDALVDARRQLTSVPVAKPSKQMWFRVLPGEEWQIPAALLEWEEDGTRFFVHPDIYADIASESKRVILRTVVTPQAAVRLWPLRQPNADGTDNEWFQSARRAAARAEREWIRMVANRDARGYDIFAAETDFGEPKIPEQSFADLLKIAFAGKIIDSLNHPVIARLLGRSR